MKKITKNKYLSPIYSTFGFVLLVFCSAILALVAWIFYLFEILFSKKEERKTILRANY